MIGISQVDPNIFADIGVSEPNVPLISLRFDSLCPAHATGSANRAAHVTLNIS